MCLGNQYWFGLRKPPCQFLFGVCPCLQVEINNYLGHLFAKFQLQLFGNVSYSLYTTNNNSSSNNNNNSEQVRMEPDVEIFPEKKKKKKAEAAVAPVITLEMPD